MAFKFCPECGYKFDKVYKFCPECGIKLDEIGTESEILNDLKEDINLEQAFEQQLDSAINDSESYEKELNKALILCKRKMFDQAAYIYETILNKNFKDINAYIGMLRISSENFTILEGEQIEKDLAALFNVLSPDSLFQRDELFISFLKKKGIYEKWCSLSNELERLEEIKREEYRKEVYKKIYGEDPLSNELLGKDSLEELSRFKKVDEYIDEEKREKACLEAIRKQKEETERKKLLEKLEKEKKREEEKRKKIELELQLKKEKEEAKLKEKEEKKRIEQEKKEIYKQTYQTKMIKYLKTLVKIGVSNLETCIVPEGVKNIAGYAFNTCKIDTLVLPSSLTNLEPYAFVGDINCLDMHNTQIFSIDKEVFKNANIKHLILPANLSSRYEHFSLYDLKELETIEIKDNPNFTIESKTLINKEKNEVVYLPPKNKIKVLNIKNFITPVSSICGNSLQNKTLEEVILPDCIEEIKENTFSNAENLIKVFSKNLKLIRKEAFKNCYNLKEINLRNVNGIEESAFSQCSKLENIVLPDNCSIGINAFYNCSGIKKVSIGKFSTIASKAFLKCINLMDLELASNLRINEEAFELCSSLKKVIINEDSLIQDHVFAGCDCLEEVTINKNCTLSVVFFNPDMGRLYCKKLKKVYIGENVKIGAYCFNNSINLSEITVEQGAVIEEGAFGKTNLKFVSIPRGCKVSRKAFPEDCKVKKPFFGIF